MTTETKMLERRKLQEVAREYRKRGYEVIIEPAREQLPDFLAQLGPTMLARSSKENVVVEVKTSESIAQPPEIDAIAKAVHGKPSWRFELVVTNPRERSSIVGDNTEPDRREILYRIQEAKGLLEQEHGEAAVLIAWSATEALMRRLAQEEGIPLDQFTPSYLMKSLVSFGIIDKTQYETLLEGMKTRNAIAHGFNAPQSLIITFTSLTQVAEKLFDQAFASVQAA